MTYAFVRPSGLRSAERNLWLLTAAQSLGGASTPIVVSLGGLVGQQLASDPSRATLPVSMMNLGLALGTLPAAMIMRRFGRRTGYLFGACMGVAAGLVATFGILGGDLAVFCAGTMMAGLYAAYVQSYRFAAMDGLAPRDRSRAVSRVMLGGLVAAIIGPQLVIWTRDAYPTHAFAGSFLSQSALAMLAIPVLMGLRSSTPRDADGAPQSTGGRSLWQIMANPRYLLAVATGVVSYALMTFVMTAAPMAMVGCGHSVGTAALGIQWHVLAMFGPSFFTGRLMARFGKARVAAVGLLLIGLSATVALSGLQVAHFWVALVLLGIGWNFGFIGATAMVSDCHTPEERGKAQGMNDMFVFGTVACASFLAGSLLYSSGWAMVNWIVFPAIGLVLVPLLWQAGRID